VTVDLPRAAAAPAAPASRRGARLTGSDVTILLVDDEEAVRAVTATILRELGYSVREAPSGEAALAILDQDIGTDVLLTDLVMPGMNGSQLAMAAEARHPDMAVVFLSGYADSLGDALAPRHRLVRKPFVAADLHQAVEAALGDRRAVPGRRAAAGD
jgi:CheY-like chemotaxis protein